MNVIDIILLIILAYFIWKGLRVGFVRLIGSIIGIVLGAWLAGQFYDMVAQWLMEYTPLGIMISIVLAFIGIFIIVNVVIGILVAIITGVFHIIPFATLANRVIGAALGLLEGLLLVGLIIWVITLFPFKNSFTQQLEASKIAQYFTYTTKLVQPLLPASLRDVDFSFLQNLQDLTDEKAEYLQQNMPKFFERIKQEKEAIEQQVQEEINKNGEASTDAPQE